MSEAPGELKRLLDLLDQLELLLGQTSSLVERQRGDASLGKTSLLTGLRGAISTCESKLSILEGIVNATKQASTVSDRTSRTLGFLKLVSKRRDIQEIEHQLHNAINLLSLTLMINLT
jgi:hypothetical protein